MSVTSPTTAGGPATAGAEHVDVLVIGAGLSGISAGYYLQKDCPKKSYAILEGREAMGGTWDLFRYPGIRSDSDLYTFGFSFRPWRSDKSIASGELILDYLRETAAHFGIDRKIRYGHRVVAADWNRDDALWSVEVALADGARKRFTCSYFYACSGYYDYEAGYTPHWPGVERFGGTLIHPQHWPKTLDYAGKRVVVIGSGATAVTIVPEMARTAASVTMLQRSPTYIVSLPAEDAIANAFRKYLPAPLAHGLSRWKNVLITLGFYQLARRAPEKTKQRLLEAAQKELGPDYDVGTHLTPRYKPWDQRLCLIPDGDLFKAIRDGQASIATDEIDTFTETGIKLASGRTLEADIVVTATGLVVKMMGGVRVSVDGVATTSSQLYLYKGMMLSGVPNLAVAIGYTNASWTLKCELTSRYVCRVINYLDAKGWDWAVPQRGAEPITEEPSIGLTSGYIQRAAAILPKQGAKKPWKLYQNYALDLAALKFGAIDDGTMTFGRRTAARRAA